MRTKLIVPYVLLTVLIAVVGMVVVTWLVTSSVRERFVNQLLEASRAAADGVVRAERGHLQNLRLLAFTEGVPEALARRDAAALSNLLLPLAHNNHIEVFSAIDARGGEVLTLARGPGASDYVRSSGVDFSAEPLVTDVLLARSDARGDKYSALMPAAQGTYLITSAPVRDAAGKLVGVLLVGTSLEALAADLKSQALADVFFLDSSGKLLATTLPPPDEGYGALEAGAAAGTTSQTHALRLYNRRFEAVDAPLVVRGESLGVLGVVLPSTFITSAGSTSRNWLGLLFTLGTAGVIAVGYSLSQSIARPILRLRAVSQAVAAGDLEQRTGLSQADEIGELATAFDGMTLKLRERTAEAERLYQETVERNKDLAAANAKLQVAQQQLVQSEKLAAIGQLTAGIVHDVKNPLAIIIGLAEELPEHYVFDEQGRKSLRAIGDHGRRANQIVTDLLKFARHAPAERQCRDLRETVEMVLHLSEYLFRKARISVVRDLPATPVMVFYDAAQIEQVIMNLVQNAVQAMPDGGSLRLQVCQAGEAATIVVADTGIGIAPANLSRIFDPFFTTKPAGEGTGLGLSVSYGIVASHAGRIDVASTVGQGTTFTVVLPLDSRAAVSAEAA